MAEYPRKLSPEELEQRNKELQEQHERYQRDYEENVKPRLEAQAHEKAVRRQALEQSGELTPMTEEEIRAIGQAWAEDFIDESKVARSMGSLEGTSYWRDPKTGEGFSRPDDYDRLRDAFKKKVLERLDSLMEKWKHQS